MPHILSGQYVNVHVEKIGFWESVMSDRKLNDGEWHHVTILISMQQIRLIFKRAFAVYSMVDGSRQGFLCFVEGKKLR